MAGVHTYIQLGMDVTIYAIDHSVGVAGRNRTDDVQLIQVLINRQLGVWDALHKEPDRALDWRVLDKSGRQIDKLAVDGICGPLTLSAILASQRALNKWRGCAIDGRIDAIKEGRKSQYETGRVEFYAAGVRNNKVVREPIMETRFTTMYILAHAVGAGPNSQALATTTAVPPWDIYSLPEPLRSSLLRSSLDAAIGALTKLRLP